MNGAGRLIAGPEVWGASGSEFSALLGVSFVYADIVQIRFWASYCESDDPRYESLSRRNANSELMVNFQNISRFMDDLAASTRSQDNSQWARPPPSPGLWAAQ